ncbi:hypothetical protein GE061_020017 [Apolygus lucorum]|uniref:Uncharacterized protein n=1 Tax=Apolygus lucorum TaxID=248454 RepID=A0A6A4J9P8_APOLU|nr:hypothetical protein GE061_020017 [Apolygus lucorum]
MECPICSITGTKEFLIAHYSDEHSIECASKSLTFDSLQQFEHWKEQMEKESKAHFVKPHSATVRKDGSQRVLYFCSRNGYSTSNCTVRRPRQNGKSKIQGYCPASLVVIVSSAGSISVDYLDTHVGHSLDLEFIRVTNERNDYPCSRSVESSPGDENDGPSFEPSPNFEGTDLIVSEDIASKEVGTLVHGVSKESGPSIRNLEEYKKKLVTILENVKEKLLSASSIEQLQTAENLINPIIPTLCALEEKNKVEFHPSPSTSSDKKRKIEPQKQFTLKRKKKERNKTITKPSFDEQQNITLIDPLTMTIQLGRFN